MKFNVKYFILFMLFFLIEILIAKTLTTGFIRHTFGDYLAIIVLFFFVKSFFNLPTNKVAIGVLIFSYTVEILQSVNLVGLIGLKDNRLANIVIGNTYSTGDMIAYTFGFLTIILFTPLKNKINAYKTLR